MFDYDVGLTQQIKTIENFKKMSIADLSEINFFGFKSKNELYLTKYTGIDINCSLRNPLFIINKENQNNIKFENDSILFSNVFFADEEKIKFNHCKDKHLFFANCIFLSHFLFEEKPKTLHFDNCCFNVFSLNTADCDDTTLTCSICEIVNIYSTSCQVNRLNISHTEIGKLIITDFNANNTSFTQNTIHKIKLNKVINLLNFDYLQLKCFSNNTISVSIKDIKKLVDYNAENKNYVTTTLNFLKQLEYVKEDVQASALIDVLINKTIKRKLYHKLILSFFGYFMQPEKIIIESIITVFAFAFLFVLNKQNLNATSIKESLVESVGYFLGNLYLDISMPEKVLSIIERFFGFLLINAFTISLGRKFIK